MKKLLIYQFFFLHLAIGYSQNKLINGIVTYKSSGSVPIENVQVTALGAHTTYTNSTGYFQLEYASKSAGDRASILASKTGYRVVNQKVLEALRIPKDPMDEVVIVLCKEEDWIKDVQLYYDIIVKDINQTHKDKLARIHKQFANDVHRLIMEKEKLATILDAETKKAEERAKSLASIDIDSATKSYKQAIQNFLDGKLQRVIKDIDNQQLKIEFIKARQELLDSQEEIQKIFNLLKLEIDAFRQSFLYKEAIDTFKDLIEMMEEVKGINDLDLANQYQEIGFLYSILEDNFKAIKYISKSLKIKESLLDPLDLDLANLYYHLALNHKKSGNIEQAIDFQNKAIKIQEEVLGIVHIDLFQSYTNFSDLMVEDEDYFKALEFQKKAIEIGELTLDNNHPDLFYSYQKLALIDQQLGLFDEALVAQQKAISLQHKAFESYHPAAAQSYHNLAKIYQEQGAFDQAKPVLQESLKIREQIYGKNHPEYISTLNNLGELYEKMGLEELADSVYEEVERLKNRDFQEDLRGMNLSIKNIMTAFDCSYDEANNYLRYIATEVSIFKSCLEMVASNKVSNSTKDALIQVMVNSVFGEDVTVMVSSPFVGEQISQFSLKQYLYLLSKSSTKYNYRSIYVYWDYPMINSTLSIASPIELIEKMSISQQYLNTFYKNHHTYFDRTDKKLKYVFSSDSKKNLTMLLNSILIKEDVFIPEEDLERSKLEFNDLLKKFSLKNN